MPEYYPTRTELGILEACASDIAERAGPGAQMIELGGVNSLKARILLDALEAPAAYIPIDISREHLRASAEAIHAEKPGLEVLAVCADYTQPLLLPEAPGAGMKLGFFPGSTIGNLQPDEAILFLAAWAEHLGPDAAMVVGVDLRKDASVLEPAYDDSQGVTSEFTRNLLVRANRELGANFEVEAFAHRARYDAVRGPHRDPSGKPERPDRAPGRGRPCPSPPANACTWRTATNTPSTASAASLAPPASGRPRCGPIRTSCSACTGCRPPFDSRAWPRFLLGRCSRTGMTSICCWDRPPAGLIGLLFVVVSLTAGIERSRALRGAKIYMSPIVFHLGVLVMISGLCMFPDMPPVVVGAVAAAAGVVGVAYAAYVGREISAKDVESFGSDVVRYGVAVAVLYLAMIGAGAMVLARFGYAPQVLAAVLLAMFLLMIHNAWDLVVWITPRQPDSQPEPPVDAPPPAA